MAARLIISKDKKLKMIIDRGEDAMKSQRKINAMFRQKREYPKMTSRELEHFVDGFNAASE